MTTRLVVNGYAAGGHADAVAIDSSGRIVVAGTDGDNFALARYQPNGSLDPTFGSGGELTTAFSRRSWASDLAIDPAGDVVAAGRTCVCT